MSNGLRAQIGSGSQAYGPSSTMSLWLEQPPTLGGTLQYRFSIQGQ